MRQQFKRRNRSCRSIRRGATDEESRSVISSNLNLRTTLTVASTKTYPYFISTNSLTAICWFSPRQRRTHPPSWIAWCEVGFRSSAVSLRRIHHFRSSMARRTCWLLERHVSEKDELENQKLSHTHLYPVSQIITWSVASFDPRTPLILFERSRSPILAPIWECLRVRMGLVSRRGSRRVWSMFMVVIAYGA